MLLNNPENKKQIVKLKIGEHDLVREEIALQWNDRTFK